MSDNTSSPYDPLPSGGYRPPDSAFQLPAQGSAEDDPLVNPRSQGLSGWFGRYGGVLRRSGRQLSLIFLLTQAIPSVLVAFLGLSLNLSLAGGLITSSSSPYSRAQVNFGAIFLALLVYGVLVFWVQMTGYAAATYLATRQAAGMQVGLGEAFGFGVRRSFGLFGWNLLAALVFGVVTAMIAFCAVQASPLAVFCVLLPAAYFLLACAMIGPVYLFERRNPIGRSFSILHENFAPVLGRLLLVGLVLVANAVVSSVISGLLLAMRAQLEVPLVLPTLIQALISGLLAVLVSTVVLGGILVTYAEFAGESAAQLANALRGPGGGPDRHWSER